MSLDALHPTFQLALALHEALRRLGVPAEDLYVLIVENPPGFIVKPRQGTAECNFLCGEIPGGLPFDVDSWTSAVHQWNTAPTAEKRALWYHCCSQFNVVRLVQSLREAGFLLPDSIDFPLFEHAPQA